MPGPALSDGWYLDDFGTHCTDCGCADTRWLRQPGTGEVPHGENNLLLGR